MRSVNRCAISVRPKPPFFEWAEELQGAGITNPEIWCSVYLVDDSKDADHQAILKRHFASIFDEQLASWHHEENAWPTPRTFAMFEQWFEAEVADLVLDLSNRRLQHDR